jgi:hypothetical protein
VEVRKANGADFPPKTLLPLIITIQMHMARHWKPVKFLTDPQFYELKSVLHSKTGLQMESAWKLRDGEQTLGEWDLNWDCILP